MKLKFFNPDSLDRNLKATVHKSGKLGFTVDAANKLKLDTGKSASIAINEDDPEDLSLYVIMHNDIQSNAFKIAKAGKYYYINLKSLFDSLKINYKEEAVVYDISEETFSNDVIFKFARRKISKKRALQKEISN